ncbi:hypothetical protein GCM10027280_28010 [Micromonospora polyrhachis]|uniref:Uncharacterized protein n=1 Tax=Micromonospora polyrhachis TaxID=1282883 RepID=A0A7W7WPK2_9ACTN|nr:hypothetical protein [Micromonospora polyrhachis]
MCQETADLAATACPSLDRRDTASGVTARPENHMAIDCGGRDDFVAFLQRFVATCKGHGITGRGLGS